MFCPVAEKHGRCGKGGGGQTEYDHALFGNHLNQVLIEIRGVATQKQKEWSPFLLPAQGSD